jgi:hypothetical protein
MDTERLKKKYENMSREELESFLKSYNPDDFMPEARKIVEEVIKARQIDFENYPRQESEIVKEENKLKGLGGWLIVVGIGTVLSPIRILISSVQTNLPIFKDGTWEALTTVGSEAYNPFLGPLVIGEIIFNIGLVVVSTYMIYLFFAKHYLFPRFYIAVIAISLIFILLDAFLVSSLLPNEPMFDTETAKEFGRLLISGLIWIPYMMVSKRVKATFIEKSPNG